ncbi:EF-hand domain-containing protein [Caenorhabditis elegans]|uniref:EF-hand domain-containing protein n=1 Tax=Caenorhabditis elegans TaxID=6239 RepID=O44883_CAEEL|nr:EF-hand domain-containing protein [Caenorhabditis elegans]CCD69337.1 EF-hand domain-containing protein [Caenorhabditis elegans]|eukprot:NP_494648.1 Uncharacterized protein CELE_T24E12.11 [Caenorhabditis elegans]
MDSFPAFHQETYDANMQAAVQMFYGQQLGFPAAPMTPHPYSIPEALFNMSPDYGLNSGLPSLGSSALYCATPVEDADAFDTSLESTESSIATTEQQQEFTVPEQQQSEALAKLHEKFDEDTSGYTPLDLLAAVAKYEETIEDFVFDDAPQMKRIVENGIPFDQEFQDWEDVPKEEQVRRVQVFKDSRAAGQRKLQ